MPDPQFRSPGARTVSGDRWRLSDQTGMPLGRRFSGGSRPGTATRHGDELEWSVSPGEWTVTGGTGEVDLTHARAVFSLSGEQAVALLAKVCALDFSHDMFPSGAAARTLVAGVATEIVRDDRHEVASYLVLPSRSFGRYLWEVLVDAGEEFALT